MKMNINGLAEFNATLETDTRFSLSSCRWLTYDTVFDREIKEDLERIKEAVKVRFYLEHDNRYKELFHAYGVTYRDVEIEVGLNGWVSFRAQKAGQKWEQYGSLTEGARRKLEDAYKQGILNWYAANIDELRREATIDYKLKIMRDIKQTRKNLDMIEKEIGK